MSDSPESATRRSFREAAKDTGALAAKYGFGTFKIAGNVVGVSGAPLVLGWTGYQTYTSFQEGKPVQGLMNAVTTAPEIYEIGVAGRALITQGLKQGLWQGVKAGGARLITGTSFAVGVGGGLALTLGVDLAQSWAHESGWNVDPGFITSHMAKLQNAENVAGALFKGDTAPFKGDILTAGTTQTLTQTGPYTWDTETSIPNMAGAQYGMMMAPTVLKGQLVQTGMGNFFEKEMKYFSTFHGNYPAVTVNEKGEMQIIVGKDKKPMMDDKMNFVAQQMYENPEQAMGLFRDFLYERTIKTAIDIANREKITVNGIKGGQVLSENDAIPQALLERAGAQVLKDTKAAWQLGGDRYFTQALNYLDPKYVRPENINIAKMEAYRVIENRFSGNVESFMDNKGGFNWQNSVHLAQMHTAIDKAIELERPAGPKARASAPARPTVSVGPEPLKTRLPEEEIHKVNRNTLNTIVGGNLIDSETNGFKHDILKPIQDGLVQAGYLSATYATGNINGFTMRAIDKAIKAEMQPGNLTPEQQDIIAAKASETLADLKINPADPKSFDPRVLSFQTDAYLLGTYTGNLDGLSGPKTAAAVEKMSTATLPDNNNIISASQNTVQPRTEQTVMAQVSAPQPSGP